MDKGETILKQTSLPDEPGSLHHSSGLLAEIPPELDVSSLYAISVSLPMPDQQLKLLQDLADTYTTKHPQSYGDSKPNSTAPMLPPTLSIILESQLETCQQHLCSAANTDNTSHPFHRIIE